MVYSHFNELMTAVETARGWPAGDGWKHILRLHSTHMRIEDCQVLYKQGKFNFVHETGFTGFILKTVRPAESDARGDNTEVLCYIPLKEIDTVTFDIANYKEIYTPLKKIFGIMVNINIEFEKDYYEFDTVNDAIMRVRFTTHDPVTVTIGVFTDPDVRDAATDASGSVPIRKPGIYYLKAFAVGPDGATGTDICTVVIGSGEETDIYFITVDEDPFYTSEDKWLTVMPKH